MHLCERAIVSVCHLVYLEIELNCLSLELTVRDSLLLFILVNGNMFLEHWRQNNDLFAFFITWLSTKIKLLHLKCVWVRHKLHLIEFLELTDLLHVLQRESNVM